MMIPSTVLVFAIIFSSWSTTLASYTNDFAVEIDGGLQEADRVARELNCVNKGEILEGFYLFSHNHVAKRSVSGHEEAKSQIESHPEVKWVEQQKVLSRKKRQLWRMPLAPPESMNVQPHVDLMHLNDKRWPQMWYINRGSRLDMNVQKAWVDGITGKGIHVTILDDGIERSHPDLQANYDPRSSYDVNENDNDPTPRYDLVDSNRHGTRCAGEVAATANNSNCAVGVAYNAGIGGVRMLDGDVTDAVEARSLQLNNQHIDIYSASWGPDDDGKTVDGPGRLATQAFLKGIAEGRGGKGSIFVWASGNGGRDHDNCNCDGYTNSIWTLSVSSATENGLIPWYSEACASTLATTYSSGSAGERKVITTDLHHACTSTHTGTSASAPMAAGIIALTLEANPNLNWRDVQHITIRCAHKANLRAPHDWSVNNVGRDYSHSFGYGLMDAHCMVLLAKNWTTVPKQIKATISGEQRVDLMIPGKSQATSTMNIKDARGIKYLEHVQAHVTLSASRRGDVVIYLISPSGTRSMLLAKRPRDYSRVGFNDWPFLTVHMWEENPIGTWEIEVQNVGRSIVELREWSLTFFGTSEHPQPEGFSYQNATENVEQPNAELHGPSQPSLPVGAEVENGPKAHPASSMSFRLEHCSVSSKQDWCSVCDEGYINLNGRCVLSCPETGYYQGISARKPTCIPCYYSCQTCSGPNDYQCLSCFGDATLEEESPNAKYCHNKSLVDEVFSSTRWYYILSVGFVVNFIVLIVLIIYIIRCRNNRSSVTPLREPIVYSPVHNMVNNKSSGDGIGGNGAAAGGGNGSGSKLMKNLSAVPFRDYDSSSEDEEIYRKPYSDN